MHASWLRSRQARLLLAASLSISLLLGVVSLLANRLHSTSAGPVRPAGTPVSDQQSQAQAVGATKDIVAIAGLRTTSAGYLLMSCQDRDSPPYQGAVYLTFAVPAETPADVYVPSVVSRLVTDGWAEGVAPANHAFAATLTKNAVTAVIYRHDDNVGLGTLRLYGECRNMTDHRVDSSGWVDITGEFGSTR